jgi:putative peptide zinc metalloprotease protein
MLNKEIKLNMRNNIEVIPYVTDNGTFRYYLKDPTSGEIYEFGEGEYFLIKQLESGTSLNSICLQFTSVFHERIDAQQIETFVRKLDAMGLLANGKIIEHISKIRKDEASTFFLGNPDDFLQLFQKICTLISVRLSCVIISLLVFFSIGSLFKYFGDYFYQLRLLRQIYGSYLIFLGPVMGFLLVYPLAEFAKGIACKYYGGQVTALKVSLLFKVAPLFYVDIADALWTLDKSKRLRIFSCGLIVQLLLWSIFMIIWMSTNPWSPINNFSIFFSFIILLFFFFNLNPMSSRDGYYLLTTKYEIEDLRSRSENFFLDWVLFRPVTEPIAKDQRLYFLIYGFMRFFFKDILSLIFLGYFGHFIIQNFQGIGAIVFLIILYLRFEELIKNNTRLIFSSFGLLNNESGFVKIRFLIKLMIVPFAFIILFLPYPFEVGGEFTVRPLRQLSIRSDVAGTIKTVLVKENEIVTKGQPVATLDDSLFNKRVESLKAALDEQEAYLSLKQKGARPEEIAKAAQEVEASIKRLEYSGQEAKRYRNMYDSKAIPETEYMRVSQMHDIDKEKVEIAKRNLELVKSGPRDEEIKAIEAEIRRIEVELSHAIDDLNHTTLLSPMNGVVITSNLDQTIGHHLEIGDLFAIVEDPSSYVAEVEVPEEDINEVKVGVPVKLRTWSEPNTLILGRTMALAPMAYEKSLHRSLRGLSEREMLFGQKELIKDKGKVIRVVVELTNNNSIRTSDVTGYAKIDAIDRPVGLSFFRWLFRLICVEIWSWIP